MKLSDGEKLILVMLSEIHQRLEIENGVDSTFVLSAILEGNLWALKERLPGIFHGYEPAPDVVAEVVEIMEMWDRVEFSYTALSPDDKMRVAKEAVPFGEHVEFTGFDGNGEPGYVGVARFLVNDLERFSAFKGRDLDSHLPLCLSAYRRMLTIYRNTSGTPELGATELINILKAKAHPEKRLAVSGRS